MASTTNHTGRNRTQTTTRAAGHSSQKKENTLGVQAAAFSIRAFLTILFYLIMFLIIKEAATTAYQFTYPIFGDVGVEKEPGTDKKVTVVEDESLNSVIQDLTNKNLIVNNKSFYIYCKLSFDEDKQIVPGTYVLNTSQNYKEIVDILTNDVEEEK